MSVMTQLSEAIKAKNVDLSADVDLPLHLINVYACSIYRFDGQRPVHTFVGAIYTAVAMKHLSDWSHANHNFRPARSTAKVAVRRLRMSDLIENPAALDTALANAKANGDSGVVSALRALPKWISQQTGVPMPEIDDHAFSGVLGAFSGSISRVLRKGLSV